MVAIERLLLCSGFQICECALPHVETESSLELPGSSCFRASDNLMCGFASRHLWRRGLVMNWR